LAFLLLEAFRGLRADRFLSVTSLLTIGICSGVLSFLLFGLSLVFSLNASRTGPEAALRVFTRAEAEDSASLASLRRKLLQLGGFDSVVFVGKDDALMEFRRDFGDEMLQYLEANPLPHSFLLYPSEKPLSAVGVRAWQDRLRLFEAVEEVSTQAPHLQWLDRWRLPVQIGAFLLLGFVAGALALIVHNAVKLNLYARRTLVENMKYAGASETFILTPFVLEGILLGLGGSLLGVVTLFFLSQFGKLLAPSLAGGLSLPGLSLTLMGGCAAIALLASVRTVRAFLRGHPA
jgi:cell division transport system permease protein